MLDIVQASFSAILWLFNTLGALTFALIWAIYPTAMVLRAGGAPQYPKMSLFLLVLAPVYAFVSVSLWYASALFKTLSSLIAVIYLPLGLGAAIGVLSATIIVASKSRVAVGRILTPPSSTGSNLPRGFLVDWLLPPDRAEEVLVNFLERYPYWVEKHGVRRARVIFVTQSLGSIASYWTDWLLRRLKLLTLLIRT